MGGRATLNVGFYRIPPGKREDLQRYTKTDGSRGTWPWQGFPTASKLVTGKVKELVIHDVAYCFYLRVCVVICFALLVCKFDALYSRGVTIAN